MRAWFLLAVTASACGGVQPAERARDASVIVVTDVPLNAPDVVVDAATIAPADVPPPPPPPPQDAGTASCAGRAGVAGQYERRVTVGGMTRVYRLHAGTAYTGARPAMLVLNFHGYTSSALQQELYTGMNAVSDARGFLVAYPDGYMASWNAGACCGSAMNTRVDDVAFVRALIDDVSSAFCVDARRVYATGMSNGGFLSHRLACELSDRIAAIAPVAGVAGVAECGPRRAVPVLQFHGTLDGLVPYNGGGITGFRSVADTMRAWAARNGCAATSQEFLRMGLAHCDQWPGCRDGAEVQLCTVDGGGHTWPGALLPVPALGLTSRDISATEMMVRFFERHPMR